MSSSLGLCSFSSKIIWILFFYIFYFYTNEIKNDTKFITGLPLLYCDKKFFWTFHKATTLSNEMVCWFLVEKMMEIIFREGKKENGRWKMQFFNADKSLPRIFIKFLVDDFVEVERPSVWCRVESLKYSKDLHSSYLWRSV